MQYILKVSKGINYQGSYKNSCETHVWMCLVLVTFITVNNHSFIMRSSPNVGNLQLQKSSKLHLVSNKSFNLALVTYVEWSFTCRTIPRWNHKADFNYYCIVWCRYISKSMLYKCSSFVPIYFPIVYMRIVQTNKHILQKCHIFLYKMAVWYLQSQKIMLKLCGVSTFTEIFVFST